MPTIQGYVESPLQKNRMIASYTAKSSQETCFILSLVYGTIYIQGALRKMQLIAYFLDHFKKIEIRYISIFGFIILN